MHSGGLNEVRLNFNSFVNNEDDYMITTNSKQ